MAHQHDVGPATCAVLTVSSSRTLDEDESGPAVVEALEAAGHDVVERDLVGDDVEAIRERLRAWLDDVDAVLVTGGTGPAPSDVTPEAVWALVDKKLPGFGERFRRESEKEVGDAAMLSRAFAATVAAGEARGIVVCLPGSPDGARLGAELIAGELGHLIGLVRRKSE